MFETFSREFEEEGNKSLGVEQLRLYQNRHRGSNAHRSLDDDVKVLWRSHRMPPDWVVEAFDASVKGVNLRGYRTDRSNTFYYGPEKERRREYDDDHFKPMQSEVVGIVIQPKDSNPTFYNNKRVSYDGRRLQRIAKEVAGKDSRILYFLDMPPRVGEKAIIDRDSPRDARAEIFIKQLVEGDSVWSGAPPSWVTNAFEISRTRFNLSDLTAFYTGPKGDYNDSKFVGVFSHNTNFDYSFHPAPTSMRNEQVEQIAHNLAERFSLGYSTTRIPDPIRGR